jgi:hypothetical protein
MNHPIKQHLIRLLSACAAFLLGLPSALAQIKVACVGDSITAGYALANPGTQSHPAQLQLRLGSGYTVGNFGLSGATLLKLLYLSCGNKDVLINISQGVQRHLKKHEVPHLWNVDDHGHDGASWGSNLYHFAQKLFR